MTNNRRNTEFAITVIVFIGWVAWASFDLVTGSYIWFVIDTVFVGWMYWLIKQLRKQKNERT